MNRLAKITDPAELDRSSGSIGKMRVEVPPDWAGADVEIDVPSRLVCGACDGGGCDRCGRSGAIRRPDTASPLQLQLPSVLGPGVAVRIPQPFDDGTLELLILEVVLASAPSTSCRALSDRGPHRGSAAWGGPKVVVPCVVIAALLWALLWWSS